MVYDETLLQKLPTTMTEIRLTNIKISDWPDLSRFPNLQKLCLINCELQNVGPIPQTIQYLNLSYNQLKEIPSIISNLPQLTHFFCSHNPITKLPKSLTHHPSITHVGLCNIQIQDYTPLMHIPNLSSLHIGTAGSSLSLPYIHLSRSLSKLTIYKRLYIHVAPEHKIHIKTLDVTSAVNNLDGFHQFERIENVIGVLSNNEIPHGNHTIQHPFHKVRTRRLKHLHSEAKANQKNSRPWIKSHPKFMAKLKEYQQEHNIDYSQDKT